MDQWSNAPRRAILEALNPHENHVADAHRFCRENAAPEVDRALSEDLNLSLLRNFRYVSVTLTGNRGEARGRGSSSSDTAHAYRTSVQPKLSFYGVNG